MLLKSYGGPTSVLKLILFAVLFAACGGSVAHEPVREQQEAAGAVCSQIITTVPNRGGGAALTVTPNANGTIPNGATATWTAISSSQFAGQCWRLLSNPSGFYSDAQKICSTQDPNECLRFDAPTGHIVTQLAVLAPTWNIGSLGRWLTGSSVSPTREIDPTPSGFLPVAVGTKLPGSLPTESGIWYTNDYFIVQSRSAHVSNGEPLTWTLDSGTGQIFGRAPANNLQGAVYQPIDLTQQYTSALTGTASGFPSYQYWNPLIAGQVLVFSPLGASTILAHSSSANGTSTLQASYALTVSSVPGTAFVDFSSRCTFSAFEGDHVYAHSCDSTSDLFDVRFAQN